MANIAEPCNCVPYENICCCGAFKGISVVQPACQTLLDGRVIINPAYVVDENKSYWTYKFITDCDKETRAISNFGIPICEFILQNSIKVYEKIDGCGEFKEVPFSLIKNDPNLGTAPNGYRWLKIETSDRYDKGVCVVYLIEIAGDYPYAIQPIKVKAGTNVFTFDCGCFLVPKCQGQGKLSVIKECKNKIINNQVFFEYKIKVINTGNAALNNVQYKDTINVPSNLVLGTITVNIPTLSVDDSNPNLIIISGNIGTINAGQQKEVIYSFPVIEIKSPDKYVLFNTVEVAAFLVKIKNKKKVFYKNY